MLFKISRGVAANLPATKTGGYCYFTIDEKKFYVDYPDEDGVVQRAALNAADAETLMGASLSTILNSSEIEIPTSKAVLDALAEKQDKISGVTGQIAGFDSNGDLVAQNKPTYTASEVGARPNTWTPSASDVGADASGTASGLVASHNSNTSAHSDIRTAVSNAASAASAAQSRADSAYNLANGKQDAITGTSGQFVVIGSDGKPTTKTIANAEEVSF